VYLYEKHLAESILPPRTVSQKSSLRGTDGGQNPARPLKTRARLTKSTRERGQFGVQRWFASLFSQDFCVSGLSLERLPRPGAGRGHDRAPQLALGDRPGAPSGRRLRHPLAALFFGQRGEHRRDRGQFGGRRVSGENADLGGLGGAVGVVGHSGMFPCFLGGIASRFVFSARSALMTATRVAAGSMTPSSSPRSAARNGLATL